MLREIRQLLRLIMMTSKLKQTTSGLSKGILVLCWSEKTQPSSAINCTVAAAGPWCAETEIQALKLYLEKGIIPHFSSCPEPDPEELSNFTDLYGTLKFLVSFKMEISNWPSWQSHIQTYLQTFHLANGLIKVHLKFQLNDQASQYEMRAKNRRAVVLEDRLRVTLDVSFSELAPNLVNRGRWCLGGHPVAGVKLPLSIPPKVMDQGLFGELSVHFATLWKPCVQMYPNLPTELKNIQVLIYSPSNIPVPCPPGFSQTLPSALDSQQLGLKRLNCSSLKDLVYSGSAIYTEENDNCEDPDQESSRRPLQQSLQLFLFIQHKDSFICQISDHMTAEWLIECHLEEILSNNRQALTAAVQSELSNSMKAYNFRKKQHNMLLSASEVILSSIIKIVTCSSNVDFRNGCFNHMKVRNTRELTNSLEASLWKATSWKFVHKFKCSLIQEQTEDKTATRRENRVN